MTIKVSDVYTDTPGGRKKTDGPFSGEEFREEFLEPFFRDQQSNDDIVIDLDGCEGYATAFLEEVFGGLVRKFGIKLVKDRVTVISTDEPLLVDEVQRYIANATK